MNASTIVRFLFGRESAIREIAGNRAALLTGIVLVLLTGIARNYDQSCFYESPLWLFGPLIFSSLSGPFLYGIVIRGFARPPFDNPPHSQWPAFMSVFWMTAPIAWLYAIPVERFMSSYHAAQANLTILGIVSLWRVLLMGRVTAVLLRVPFLRALGWIVFGASLEIIIVVFFSGFGRSIMTSMAGMRNAPEENLLTSAFEVVWKSSWVVMLVTLALLGGVRFRGKTGPLPKLRPGKMPWAFLAIAAAAWVAIAIVPQKEQHRFITHAWLVHQKDYAGGLAYLARYQRADFPPGRRLEPNPYEFRVWADLPPTVALLTTNTPPWIRQVYFFHLTATLSHYYPRYDSPTNVAAMFAAIERLPEGREWVLSNQVALGRKIEFRNSDEELSPAAARSNIMETFRRMGMAETNLVRAERANSR